MKSLNFDHETPKKRRDSRTEDVKKKRIIALTYEKGDHQKLYGKGDK